MPYPNTDMKLYSKMNSGNTALIVIDVVNGCAHEKCEIPEWDVTFGKIREMVPRLEKFIGDFRKSVGGKIIFAKIEPWIKGKVAENIDEFYSTYPEASYYSKDESDFPGDFFGIKPLDGEIVVSKNTNSVFASPEMLKILKENDIRYLVVAGIFGDGCVMMTIDHGFGLGYNFVLIDDCIETTDKPERQELQKLLKTVAWPYLIGPVVKGEEFINSWKEGLFK